MPNLQPGGPVFFCWGVLALAPPGEKEISQVLSASYRGEGGGTILLAIIILTVHLFPRFVSMGPDLRQAKFNTKDK